MFDISILIEKIDKIADTLEKEGLYKEAIDLDIVSNTIEKWARVLPKKKDRPSPIFPRESPNVLDNKDHFPIPDLAHARNALARVNQYSEVPSWYKGTLEELRKKVVKTVKSKFPSIKIDEEKFNLIP